MRATGEMGCGVITLSGFMAMYGSHWTLLRDSISRAKESNLMVVCTIADYYLKSNPKLVQVLRDSGFEQVCRWENGAHPSRDGGAMLNTFMLKPKPKIIEANKSPAKYNWMDKRRKTRS